jgi:RNA polymerase sigma-70 factor (ECF subfamily)
VKETEVINKVLQGDTDAFRLLVDRYQKPIIRFIKHMINDSHICEDIAQDVLFSAYKALDTFDSNRSSFSTWLFTIAKNKSLNVLKKKRAIFASQLPEKTEINNPSDDISEREFFDELDKILQTLPAEQKTAFVLAELQELPYDEIAQIEGAKIGTIKSRISRAKEKIKSALKNLDGDLL